MSQTPPGLVRSRTCKQAKNLFEHVNTVKSLWEKSKVLILKVNMQVIVKKSVWGPGS